MRRSRLFLKSFCVPLALSLGMWTSAIPMVALAQEYIPPNRGLPGRREGGGTRGNCIASQQRLTALMPVTNFGQTTQGYPTFYWYVPEIRPQAAEFILLDENDNEVYQTTFRVTGDSGVISLSLPENSGLPPLEVGKDYHWYFSLICDPLDRSGDQYTEGWIQRIDPPAELVAQIQAAPLSDHPTLYARAGIWFDALTTLAELRRTEPGNFAVREGWRTLLSSVNLNNIAEQPFIDCCSAPDSQTTSQLSNP